MRKELCFISLIQMPIKTVLSLFFAIFVLSGKLNNIFSIRKWKKILIKNFIFEERKKFTNKMPCRESEQLFNLLDFHSISLAYDWITMFEKKKRFRKCQIHIFILLIDVCCIWSDMCCVLIFDYYCVSAHALWLNLLYYIKTHVGCEIG